MGGLNKKRLEFSEINMLNPTHVQWESQAYGDRGYKVNEVGKIATRTYFQKSNIKENP